MNEGFRSSVKWGFAIGATLSLLVLVGTVAKGVTGGWEVLGWMGIVGYLASMPLSILLGLDGISGMAIYLMIVAPVANWTLLGFLVGTGVWLRDEFMT